MPRRTRTPAMRRQDARLRVEREEALSELADYLEDEWEARQAASREVIEDADS